MLIMKYQVETVERTPQEYQVHLRIEIITAMTVGALTTVNRLCAARGTIILREGDETRVDSWRLSHALRGCLNARGHSPDAVPTEMVEEVQQWL